MFRHNFFLHVGREQQLPFAAAVGVGRGAGRKRILVVTASPSFSLVAFLLYRFLLSRNTALMYTKQPTAAARALLLAAAAAAADAFGLLGFGLQQPHCLMNFFFAPAPRPPAARATPPRPRPAPRPPPAPPRPAFSFFFAASPSPARTHAVVSFFHSQRPRGLSRSLSGAQAPRFLTNSLPPGAHPPQARSPSVSSAP